MKYFFILLVSPLFLVGTPDAQSTASPPALQGAGLAPLEDPAYLRLHRIKRVRKVTFWDGDIEIGDKENRAMVVNGRTGFVTMDESFDRQGRQTEHVYFGSEGSITWRTEFRYDEQGRLMEEEGEWPAFPRTLKKFAYNPDGQLEYILISKIHAQGLTRPPYDTTCCDTMHLSYDQAGREISRTRLEEGEVLEQHSYERDSLGRVTLDKAFYNWEQPIRREVRFRYDSLGRVAEKAELELSLNPPFGLTEQVSEFEYDGSGRLVFSRRENEKYIDETAYHYDAEGLYQGNGPKNGDSEVWIYDFWE